VTLEAPGARARRDATGGRNSVVDPGFAVDPVHYRPPYSPPSPNQPRKFGDRRSGGRILGVIRMIRKDLVLVAFARSFGIMKAGSPVVTNYAVYALIFAAEPGCEFS
jgi:hypothetical protein